MTPVKQCSVGEQVNQCRVLLRNTSVFWIYHYTTYTRSTVYVNPDIIDTFNCMYQIYVLYQTQTWIASRGWAELPSSQSFFSSPSTVILGVSSELNITIMRIKRLNWFLHRTWTLMLVPSPLPSLLSLSKREYFSGNSQPACIEVNSNASYFSNIVNICNIL